MKGKTTKKKPRNNSKKKLSQLEITRLTRNLNEKIIFFKKTELPPFKLVITK